MRKSLSEKSPKNKYLDPDTALLLAWYDRHARVLPWRAKKGEKANPYYVWLSEIMLQQTTVATVGPYFLKFLKRWPRLEDLAAAKHDDILRMWAGLGYYRRAHLLHDCAGVIMREWEGQFPTTEVELLSLPGIGPYTSAAVAAIAFNQKANVVDGNVERVMARLYAIEEILPAGKKILKEKALALLPDKRFGDYAQALMDLGATICTPRSPKCDLCPWQKTCLAFKAEEPERFPVRAQGKKKPLRKGTAFILLDKQGRILLRRRSEKGLLAGMMGVPSSEWAEKQAFSFDQAPVVADWTWIKGRVLHVFTHFNLELRVAVASLSSSGHIRGRWVLPEDLHKEALPSVMRKILFHAGYGKAKK